MPQKAEVALLELGPGGLPRPMLVAADLLGTNPPAPDLDGWLRAERAELVQAVREIGDRQRRDNLNNNSRNDQSVHPRETRVSCVDG
jgi:hypothetical protein